MLDNLKSLVNLSKSGNLLPPDRYSLSNDCFISKSVMEMDPKQIMQIIQLAGISHEQLKLKGADYHKLLPENPCHSFNTVVALIFCLAIKYIRSGVGMSPELLSSICEICRIGADELIKHGADHQNNEILYHHITIGRNTTLSLLRVMVSRYAPQFESKILG